MIIKYFSSIRETIGKPEETLPHLEGVSTVSELLDHLCEQSEAYATALSERKFIRVAVNQVHVTHTHKISVGDEIAVFPPVTGG
jgi:molybdopterin converting factor subunit 1